MLFLSDLTSGDPPVWLACVFWLTSDRESACVLIQDSLIVRSVLFDISLLLYLNTPSLLGFSHPSQPDLSSTPILTQTQGCVDVLLKWLLKIKLRSVGRERECGNPFKSLSPTTHWSGLLLVSENECLESVCMSLCGSEDSWVIILSLIIFIRWKQTGRWDKQEWQGADMLPCQAWMDEASFSKNVKGLEGRKI